HKRTGAFRGPDPRVFCESTYATTYLDIVSGPGEYGTRRQSWTKNARRTVSIGISFARWNIPNVCIQIQRRWITKISIRPRDRHQRPVGTYEPPQPVRVISRSEIIEPGFDVSLVSAEQVVVLITVDELQLAAPGIEVGFFRDVPLGVGND